MDTNRIAPDLCSPFPSNLMLRNWFADRFTDGPTPIQIAAWPILVKRRNALLIAPTGSGKSLAAFMPIIDSLLSEAAASGLDDAVRCLYVAPMKSLVNDIRHNLASLFDALSSAGTMDPDAIRVAIRTGDTPARERVSLRNRPPQILLTTPESLSILLSQAAFRDQLKSLDSIVIDEIHALAASKRGADLAISLERAAEIPEADPQRIGISATCRPAQRLGEYLVGPGRTCEIVEVSPEDGFVRPGQTRIAVESLVADDEIPYRPLVQQRTIERLHDALSRYETTIVFANTRPQTERLTFLLKDRLRHEIDSGEDIRPVAAHHGSLDVTVRREVERNLKDGSLGLVITSTSLELGVDYPQADFVVQVGSPGSVARCLQRLGRAGHAPGLDRDGVILAASPADLATAVVTADLARQGAIEPVRLPARPLDVLCQQMVGHACGNEFSPEEFFETVRRSWTYRDLTREDFDRCVDYLCGETQAPACAVETDAGGLRWTPSRLIRDGDRLRVRTRRISRLFGMNAGTIDSEESIPVDVAGRRVGRIEAVFADRLEPGDRFVLDGRSLIVKRTDEGRVDVDEADGDGQFPIWTTDRPGLSGDLAIEISRFREQLGDRLARDLDSARRWLVDRYRMREADSSILVNLWNWQAAVSDIPGTSGCLIECFPSEEGWNYAVHGSFHRGASECLARAFATRLGRMIGHDLDLSIADLGFIARTDAELVDRNSIQAMLTPDGLEEDVIEALERGELLSRHFRGTAMTGMMVLRNPEWNKPKVGGFDWVSRRLYPIVAERCPDHPLIAEARRDALERTLDLHSALRWLSDLRSTKFRRLDAISPFAAAWLEPYGTESEEPVRFESPDITLQRLHERLFDSAAKELCP